MDLFLLRKRNTLEDLRVVGHSALRNAPMGMTQLPSKPIAYLFTFTVFLADQPE